MSTVRAHEELPQRDRNRRPKPAADKEEGMVKVFQEPAVDVKPRVRPESNQYEYLDHTADIQIHSWGLTVEEMFENQVLGMFDYMTDRNSVVPAQRIEFEVDGAHSLDSLLFKFMDELLFQFSAEFFTTKEVLITHLDLDNWSLKGVAWGEHWDSSRHTIGTEVKAITFGSLHVFPPGEDPYPEGNKVPKNYWSGYVVVDI